jgi:hypothetical protein
MSTTIPIQFLPKDIVAYNHTLTLTHNAPKESSTSTVSLVGNGTSETTAAIAINKDSLKFNTDYFYRFDTVKITNNGNVTLNVTPSIEDGFIFPNKEDEKGIKIEPLSSYDLIILFSPNRPNYWFAELKLQHNATNLSSPITIHIASLAFCYILTNPTSNFGLFHDMNVVSKLDSVRIRYYGNIFPVIFTATITRNEFDDFDEFQIQGTNTISFTQPNEIRDLPILFTPVPNGTHRATLTLTSPPILISESLFLTQETYVETTDNTPASTDEGNSVNGSTVVTFNVSVNNIGATADSVIVLHKDGGATGNYKRFRLTRSTTSINNRHTGELQIEPTKGLDYYIQVVFRGLSYYHSNTGDKNNPKSIKVQFKLTEPQIPPDDVAPKADTYSLMSLPFDLGNSSAIKLLQDDNKLGSPNAYSWRLFAYDRGYKEYTKERFNIANGEGFWFISKTKVNLVFPVESITVNKSDRNITRGLEPGWNIIGNPFLFNVASPEAVGSFDGVLYEYNYDEERYDTVNYMKPYKGYFVYNDNLSTTVNINIKPIEFNPSLKKIVPNNTFSTNEWKMNILLEDGKKIRDEVEIGAISPSSQKFAYHKPPPSPAGGVDMYLVSSNKSFMKYYYSTVENNMAWDLRINGLKKSSTYSLNLQKSGNIDNIDEFVIIDVETGNKINILSNTIYIPSGSTEKTYKIIVGKKQFVQDELYNIETSTYKLHQNYPNPFNPSTNIEYVISENSYVTLKVYNALGQEVSVLVDGIKERGIYSVTWNAINQSSGIYYYKLIAGNYISVKKMMLLK